MTATEGPAPATAAPAPAPAPAPPLSRRAASTVVWLIVASTFVMMLNETIVNVALPVLVTDLRVSVGVAQWLASGFLLTVSVVIPTTGYLLQRLNTRTVYLMSMSLFCLGTLVCALAPGFAVLMLGRVVQATGTAVMLPLMFTTIVRLVPVERRGAMMGAITIVIAVAPAVGPTVSGAILTSLGWRWIFLAVLAIALIALASSAVFLRLAGTTRSSPLDAVSVVLCALAFGGIVFGLSSIGDSARGEALLPPWLPMLVGVAAMVVFVLRQLRLQRTGRALLDLRPFGFRRFAVSVVLVVLGMMSMFGVLTLLPLFLQDVLKVSAFDAGLAMLPGGLVMGLLGPSTGKLYDRVGARPMVLPGMAIIALSLWGFTTVAADTPIALVIGLHVVLIVGQSFMFTPLMTDALVDLPREIDSHGSAILATLQQVAGAAGTALFVTVIVVYTETPGVAADVPGTRAAFFCAAIFATIAVPISLLMRRKGAVAA